MKHLTLRWRGRDTAAPGVAPAGIESYRISARNGRGKYKFELSTRSTRARFVGKLGSKCWFHIEARDLSGNVKPPPHTADFVIRVRRK